MEELESYQEGHDDYYMAYQLKDNPYSEDTDNYHSWIKGWKKAEREDNNSKEL